MNNNYIKVYIDSNGNIIKSSGLSLNQNSTNTILKLITISNFSTIKCTFTTTENNLSDAYHLIYNGKYFLNEDDKEPLLLENADNLYEYELEIPYIITSRMVSKTVGRIMLSLSCYSEKKGWNVIASTSNLSLSVNQASISESLDQSYSGPDVDNMWKALGRISDSKLDKAGGRIDGDLTISGQLDVFGESNLNIVHSNELKSDNGEITELKSDNINSENLETKTFSSETANIVGLESQNISSENINSNKITSNEISVDVANIKELNADIIHIEEKDLEVDTINGMRVGTILPSNKLEDSIEDAEEGSTDIPDVSQIKEYIEENNHEIDNKLDNKVDKTDYSNRLYGTGDRGVQKIYAISVDDAAPWSIPRYNGSGQIRVSEPVEDYEVANKIYVDTSLENYLETSNEESIVYGTDESGSQTQYNISNNNDNYSVALRTSTGTLKVSNPTQDNDATNKKYVDDGLSGITSDLDGKLDKVTDPYRLYGTDPAGNQMTYMAVISSPLENSIARRGTRGTLIANNPTQDNELTTKKYVDDSIDGLATEGYVDTKVAGFDTRITNAENAASSAVSAVNNKLDKVTSAYAQVYGTDANGNQTTYGINSDAVQWTAVLRGTDGRIAVGEPINPTNATTKQYVDNGLNSKLDKISTPLRVYTTDSSGNQNSLYYTTGVNEWSLVQRGGGGRISIGTPVADDNATTKKYVDNLVSTKADELDLTSLTTRVSNIKELIPEEASSDNQLADKEFVNSSIATNTANFRGTYTSESALPTTGNTPNDYAFVQTTDNEGNTIFKRFKWVDEEWLFEYDLNNSSFTAKQWANINADHDEYMKKDTQGGVYRVQANRNGVQTFYNVSDGLAPSTIAFRSGTGSLQVGTPSGNNDAATKKYVDDGLSGITSALDGKLDKVTEPSRMYITNSAGQQSTVVFSDTDAEWTIARRSSAGRLKVGTPIAANDASTKKYVDDGLATKAGLIQPTFEAENNSSIAADFIGNQFAGRSMIRFLDNSDWLGWLGVNGGRPTFVNRRGTLEEIITTDSTQLTNKADKSYVDDAINSAIITTLNTSV